MDVLSRAVRSNVDLMVGCAGGLVSVVLSLWFR